jgi:hypothetical protein
MNELATADVQINKMVVHLKNCPFLSQGIVKVCGKCRVWELCRRNYDTYCVRSVRNPLTEEDFREFMSKQEKLRTQPDMFKILYAVGEDNQEDDDL